MAKTIRACNPREIDDAGLSQAQFRVYFRVVRRAGNSWCTEGIRAMSAGCKMSKATLIDALKSLVSEGFIEQGGRGKYRPLNGSNQVTGQDSKMVQNKEQDGSNQVTEEDAPCSSIYTAPVQNKERSGSNQVTKGRTSKGEPLRENHNKENSEQLILEDIPPEITPEQIYQAYPRKVGKPKALAAIKKAIKTKPANELLKTTTDYAARMHGSDPQFIPYPSRWFGEERYDDDPQTWGNNPSSSGSTSRRNVGTLNQGRTYGTRAGKNAPKPLPDLP